MKKNNMIELQAIAYDLSNKIMTIIYAYNEKKDKSEEEAISQCMLQMGCEKMMSLVTLINNGYNILNNQSFLNLNSISSFYPIVRSLYELMMIHHALFVNPKTQEEASTLLNLWKIKGYMLRTKYENPTYYKQIKNDKKRIDSIKKRIKETELYKTCKKQFDHAFDTDKVGYFEIVTKTDKQFFTNIPFGNKTLFKRVFKDLYESKLIEDDLVYNYLSLNSHPTYISVMQFGMQKNMNNIQFELPLKSSILFVYRMIKSHEQLLQKTIV